MNNKDVQASPRQAQIIYGLLAVAIASSVIVGNVVGVGWGILTGLGIIGLPLFVGLFIFWRFTKGGQSEIVEKAFEMRASKRSRDTKDTRK